MHLWNIMIGIAVVSSAILLADGRQRTYAMVGLIASGLQALMALGLVTFGVKGISLALILGAAIAVAGVLCFWRATAKQAVAAATLLTTVGALQVARVLSLI